MNDIIKNSTSPTPYENLSSASLNAIMREARRQRSAYLAGLLATLFLRIGRWLGAAKKRQTPRIPTAALNMSR